MTTEAELLEEWKKVADKINEGTETLRLSSIRYKKYWEFSR